MDEGTHHGYRDTHRKKMARISRERPAATLEWTLEN